MSTEERKVVELIEAEQMQAFVCREDFYLSRERNFLRNWRKIKAKFPAASIAWINDEARKLTTLDQNLHAPAQPSCVLSQDWPA
jgi:hypothetical protein